MIRWFLFACLTACTVDNALYLPEGDNAPPRDAAAPVKRDLSAPLTLRDLSTAPPLIPDLSTAPPPNVPDLAKPLPDLGKNGVTCGNASCLQVCCVTQSQAPMCVAPGSCPDAGLAATCDGPEDCTTGQPSCCATISGAQPGTIGSGMAACSTSCTGSAMTSNGTSFTLSTRLCHSDSDCAGFSGSFLGAPGPWTSCCSSNGVHFCTNSAFASIGQFTCP
jgi:hypothetical protein